MRTANWVVSGIIATVAIAVLAAPGDAPPEGMAVPAYTEDGSLLRPEGYQTWMYLGASLGLSYRENVTRKPPGLFHNVYIQPEAYRHYKETGRFPEKTMLALALHEPKQKESINRHGYFQGHLVALEIALKDSERFSEGWAYFDFGDAKKSARPFPKDQCYDCHHQNAADDNVFVQFYPVMREIRAAK